MFYITFKFVCVLVQLYYGVDLPRHPTEQLAVKLTNPLQ